MEFKKCTINGVSYGRAYTEALAGLRKRQGVDVEAEGNIERELINQDRIKMIDDLRKLNQSSSDYDDELTFISTNFVDDLNGQNGPIQKQSNEHFMLALALCHSVLVEDDPKRPGKKLLKAQSPDEAALVGTARSLGYAFQGNTKKGFLIDVNGIRKEYQVLNTLEFNSTRKRMSTIIKISEENQPPKALLICKGADSIIYGRLSKKYNHSNMLESTSKHLEQYATEGLRTLCIAQRELSWSQYSEWNKRHLEASTSLDDREAKMEAVADSIERELILLGGTAIEDRLQDGVPDSISLLGDAGIKLWVLTGDKVETAINIGFSCNLLGNDMELLLLKNTLQEEDIKALSLPPTINEDFNNDQDLINYLIDNYLSRYFGKTGSIEELEEATKDHSPPDEGFGVVVDGDALKLALSNEETKRKFLLLCKQCKAVLCCRVSPAQKAAVVKLVKDTLDVMTLAIGDGSNDVAMIQAADVGVGIAGEEGRQAVMSSDYAARGDFDAYPEDYDPTDPKRPKISQYSSEHVKRKSMTQQTQSSPITGTTINPSPTTNYYKHMETSSSTGASGSTDLEQQAGYYNTKEEQRKSMIKSLDPRKTKRQSQQNPPKRRSVLDLFKRKSQGVSYYDNNSIIETYNFLNGTTEDLPNSIRTEEIAMEDFNNNQQKFSRISNDTRRISANYQPNR
ncbi:phospholipid transporting ATPase [Cerrena zonata]|uniref:Phospholipid-transporting ATPase n=1 Tax=Cerrena zonata TaxID=2478898 RepID=A0AAW0FWL5_9APHY